MTATVMAPGVGVDAKNLKKGQKVKSLTFGTYNCRSLPLEGYDKIFDDMVSNDISLLALQEIRKKEGRTYSGTCSLLMYGPAEDRKGGVGFAAVGELAKKEMKFEIISSRIARLSFGENESNITIWTVYAPTENYEIDIKEGFYKDLYEDYVSVDSPIKVIMGDFNASIGN
uniref:Endo/exonuclease/phosphatase domain-containing protein n=1 Tax=Parastrongyloides trichosuri TaxID=131310 RepID=A0A0N4ZA89_PARTI